MSLFDSKLHESFAKSLRDRLSTQEKELFKDYLQALFVEVTMLENPHQVGYRIALKDISNQLFKEELQHGEPS